MVMHVSYCFGFQLPPDCIDEGTGAHASCCCSLPAQVLVHRGVPAQQLPPAFPAVRHLELLSIDLGDGSLLTSPGAWRQLEGLRLDWCSMDRTAQPAIAAALASLPNFNRLDICQPDPENQRIPVAIASQLTSLTRLDAITGNVT
jgi:hypothetical protein